MSGANAVTAGYVDTRWGQVHYRTSGRNGPWVGLFHESPLSCRAFEKVLAPLGDYCRVVAFDTPGYGASAPPPSGDFEIPDYAQVLAEAMATLGMARPVLAGVHTGASIAVEAAQYSPAGVAGLVLTGVPLFTPQERADFLAHWTPPAPVDSSGSQLAWALERYTRIYGADAPPWMLNLAIVDLLRVADRYDWAYCAAFRHDPQPSLARFEGPVLLLNAEHDMLRGKDKVALAHARDARLVVVDGIAGQPHMRTPERYVTELASFVARLSPVRHG